MMNQLIKMWSSVNSTDKDLQEKTKTSFLAVWTAVNATKMELQRKVSTMAILRKDPYLHMHKVDDFLTETLLSFIFRSTTSARWRVLLDHRDSTELKDPQVLPGSRGPPGPKGPGDLSTCNYNEFVGTKTSGGTDAQAFVDEPSVSMGLQLQA